jgi:deazaflavin-dependent oxidoreductase (nitroreductase family)
MISTAPSTRPIDQDPRGPAVTGATDARAPDPTVPRWLVGPIVSVARVSNPWVLRLAGRPRVPVAVIEHVGRRSGRRYRTPVVPAPVPDGFVVSLPYGSGVGWCRNLVASGAGSIHWHGVEHAIVGVDVMALADAVRSLPRGLRAVAALGRFRQFVFLRTCPPTWSTSAC